MNDNAYRKYLIACVVLRHRQTITFDHAKQKSRDASGKGVVVWKSTYDVVNRQVKK